MSGIGHLAAGFAAKPATPQTPLWVLLAASEANELLYFLFTAAGIEKKALITMSITQGVRHLTSGSNPWSHGLFMSLVWSVAAAAVAFLFFRQRRTTWVIGLVVFSHWALDFLMHSNLPLFFEGSPLVGLGLENSGPGFIFMTVLDLTLLAGGVAVYLISRKRTVVMVRAG
jgi:membrane-bound metal-dependent hydrolase YbcI (DUF457 family)